MLEHRGGGQDVGDRRGDGPQLREPLQWRVRRQVAAGESRQADADEAVKTAVEHRSTSEPVIWSFCRAHR
jgi:hypothetical protein